MAGRGYRQQKEADERPDGLDEVFRHLMTENPDGTYSIRIPSECDRVITVP